MQNIRQFFSKIIAKSYPYSETVRDTSDKIATLFLAGDVPLICNIADDYKENNEVSKQLKAILSKDKNFILIGNTNCTKKVKATINSVFQEPIWDRFLSWIKREEQPKKPEISEFVKVGATTSWPTDHVILCVSMGKTEDDQSFTSLKEWTGNSHKMSMILVGANDTTKQQLLDRIMAFPNDNPKLTEFANTTPKIIPEKQHKFVIPMTLMLCSFVFRLRNLIRPRMREKTVLQSQF